MARRSASPSRSPRGRPRALCFQGQCWARAWRLQAWTSMAQPEPPQRGLVNNAGRGPSRRNDMGRLILRILHLLSALGLTALLMAAPAAAAPPKLKAGAVASPDRYG